MVYAVAVSAGFALAENILYLLRYGTSVLLLRGIVSIPAHICFSVFMGTWYGVAKKYEYAGDAQKVRLAKIFCIAVPALAHGLFDYIASNTDSGGVIALFILFVIAMFVVCWRLIKRISENDEFLANAVRQPLSDHRIGQ